jgi:ABC-type enterochelin transport system substrate-binding protein
MGTVALVACFSVLMAGCAPQSPDHSSWTDQAVQSLKDVTSEVATVTLLLRLERDRKVPGKYQQVVAQDSESAVGETMSKFGGEQPEPRDDAEYKRVTTLISDASDLLSEVRIAIVRRDEDAYPGLLRQLEGLQEKLTRAQDRLE